MSMRTWTGVPSPIEEGLPLQGVFPLSPRTWRRWGGEDLVEGVVGGGPFCLQATVFVRAIREP